MRNDREYAPTPQDMGKKIIPLTRSQKLQVEAIMDMIAALLINVRLAAQTEDEHNLINRKEN